jgi:uncharacterized protein YfaP (DUF2135 family)
MKMKSALLLFILAFTVTCQGSKARVVYGDISGTVTDGQTGLPITGATIYPVSSASANAASNGTGLYQLGHQLAVPTMYRADMTGYNSQELSVAVPKDAALSNVNFVLLPTVFAASKVVIVLTWTAAPTDLDSHTYVPDGSPYAQVFYGNLGNIAAAPYAQLDVDDTDSFGPETTTIAMTGSLPHYNGTYRFYVHNYSQDAVLSASNAEVRVYFDGALQKTYNVPAAGAGIYWHVFDLNGQTFNDINTLTDTEPPPPP